MAAVLIATPAGAAAAQPHAQATPTGPVRAATLAKLGAARPVHLTLVTGDQVTYSTDAVGHVTVAVQPGEGRSDIRFRAEASPDGYFVLPSDADGLIASGALDGRLFDVRYLAQNGYGDAGSAQVPLIVQYGQKMTASTLHDRAGALPASTAPVTLGSINGAAVRVDKKRAGSFWNTVRGNAADRPTAPSGGVRRAAPAHLGAGLSRLWLDARVKSFDDVSNAQIGAPAAWAAGYDGTGSTVGIIDTGIDATHPDLVGKVAVAQNFVPVGEPGGGDPNDVTDRFGHGTHVASIIGGTGAASGGKYKGVMPGARFAIAKALSDVGSGSDSTIIAAMQWEAARVRVVSMSLGGGPSDGTDPLSQAVNDLTAQYGTLFVIAAGNSGPGAKTVATPSAADSALSVAAVDSHDAVTWFSSRGPRAGDSSYAVKPEIAAPGYQIIAARAAGTQLGTPVGDSYVALSGTSMATPHVAAAAVAVLQAHPDWTGQQVKAALMGTSHDLGTNVYDYGAGRVDVARAVTQKVVADLPSFGAGFQSGQDGQAISRRVTYRNTGGSDVTLDLAVKLVNSNGPVSLGAAVSTATLTVPAGGSAGVDLTLDPTGLRSGFYTGALLATDASGDRVSVPIGFRIHPPMVTVRVRVDARSLHLPAGAHPWPWSLSFLRVNDDNPQLADEPLVYQRPLTSWVQVEPGVFENDVEVTKAGVYQVKSSLMTNDSVDGTIAEWSFTRPQVTFDQNSTVTFDPADTVPLDIGTDRPTHATTTNFGAVRTTASGVAVHDFELWFDNAAARTRWYATPTGDKPTVGSYLAWTNQIRMSSEVQATLVGTNRIDLGALYGDEADWLLPKFSADRHAVRLVSEDEMRAGADIRGKLVVTNAKPPENTDANFTAFTSAWDMAGKGGAAGVLTDSAYCWVMFEPSYDQYKRIPMLCLTGAKGAQLRAALGEAVRPTVDIDVQNGDPYEYHLQYFTPDRIPDNLTYRTQPGSLAAVESTYHSQNLYRTRFGRALDSEEDDPAYMGAKQLDILAVHNFYSGTRRTDYYNVTGPRLLHNPSVAVEDLATGTSRVLSVQRTFDVAGVLTQDWNGLMVPGQITPGPGAATHDDVSVYPCDACRQGDRLRLRTLAALGDALEYHVASDSSEYSTTGGATEDVHLFRDGTEIPPRSDSWGLPYYDMPPEPATYRLTDLYTDGYTGGHPGSSVSTTWTFRSVRPTAQDVPRPYVCIDAALFGDGNLCAFQPLLYPHYRFGLPPADTAPAGKPYTFSITAQTGATQNVALAGVTVWVSPDSGKTWTEVQVTPGPDNSYQAFFTNPALSASPTGTVSVRVRARNAAGDTVDQTILDAYRLA